MKLKDRIRAFSALGKDLLLELNQLEKNSFTELDEVIERAFHHNGWFDKKEVKFALTEVVSWLDEEKLTEWTNAYNFDQITTPKLVGVIMAGNIPLVGFHDYLSVAISGHKLLAKLSSKDQVLLKYVHNKLVKIEPRFEDMLSFTEGRLNTVDAVIATGSNNSSKYFDYYFANKPNIIRKNRTSVAVLSGNETVEELEKLGNDIFRYFGLGCRNVTKVYFPKGFNLDWFYKGIMAHHDVINHHKYQNNYDYHKSLWLLNGDEIWDNNFLLLKEDKSLSSPVGTLYYEEYERLDDVKLELTVLDAQIQCKIGLLGLPLGQAQKPELTDYSDNIDVLGFLLGLN